MALTKTPRTIIASGSSNAAGATTRGTLDLRNAYGGLLTIKIINGATGPAVAATVNVMIAHNSGLSPAPAAAGVDWKTIFTAQHSTAANAILELPVPVSVDVMHLQVEITGNTGQAVIGEALFSELTSVT